MEGAEGAFNVTPWKAGGTPCCPLQQGMPVWRQLPYRGLANMKRRGQEK